MEEGMERVVDALVGASSVLFITGAGVSAASGLPTYRGPQGLYGDTPTEDGVFIEVGVPPPLSPPLPRVCIPWPTPDPHTSHLTLDPCT